MKLIPGKLYRVNLGNRRAYERKYGVPTSATTSYWKQRLEDRINLMNGDILLFVKKGEYQESVWGCLAYTPYTFIYKEKIIEFQKIYDMTLKSIFEEFSECD
jgi:hypothetical protein